jgi:hypothetical protein
MARIFLGCPADMIVNLLTELFGLQQTVFVGSGFEEMSDKIQLCDSTRRQSALRGGAADVSDEAGKGQAHLCAGFRNTCF